jgi:ABC-type uncharacterized transport system substrate-binding protein
VRWKRAGNDSNRAIIVKFAARHRLPAIYAYREDVAVGGLAACGVAVIDLFRRAAGYADRILRGRIRAPCRRTTTEFQLLINLKTANALGITVPSLRLARADEAIE